MSQTLIQLSPHEISSSTHHDHEGFALPPSVPQCVQGLLRVDETNYTSVVIDPEKIPVDMAKKRTLLCFGISGTAGKEPTAMDIIGDQHHQKGGMFQQKRRRLVHPLEHLI
ncbi:hypothetical protein B0H14DRAFT_2575187 [Mycena olivaceomarginata]|nr:hypothetical protein B0H14DRAFT_2575187 [Mycena olivaceomarginata]